MKKFVAVLLLSATAMACGDDVKKSSNSSNNTSSNNTSSNNTSSNNTSSNNVSSSNNVMDNNTTSNNVSSNNSTSNNVSSGDLDLGPDDKLISDLTLAEVQENCRKTAVYSDSNGKLETCILDGYYTSAFGGEAQTDEELQAECAQVRDECLEAPTDSSYCDEETTIDCDATVGELETCLMAFSADFNAALAGFTCETASFDNEPNLDVLETLPAECEPIETACPGYFD